MNYSSGHETSGHTLAWTIAHLALYPEWQDAIYKEVTEVCGDNWPSESESQIMHGPR